MAQRSVRSLVSDISAFFMWHGHAWHRLFLHQERAEVLLHVAHQLCDALR